MQLDRKVLRRNWKLELSDRKDMKKKRTIASKSKKARHGTLGNLRTLQNSPWE